jgi:hypothetical protein
MRAPILRQTSDDDVKAEFRRWESGGPSTIAIRWLARLKSIEEVKTYSMRGDGRDRCRPEIILKEGGRVSFNP